jgi:plastocyanin
MKAYRIPLQSAACAALTLALLSLTSPGDLFATGRHVTTLDRSGENDHALTIFDANGQALPADVVDCASATAAGEVTVGPNGSFTFSPDTVTVSVGDTVRWTWEGSNHTVTSGTPCTVDSGFCSTADTSCMTAPSSNAGTKYCHTFTQAGTFHYFCRIHCGFGMTGTVVVNPSLKITSVSRDPTTGAFDLTGQTGANLSVTIKSSPDLLTTFSSPHGVSSDMNGVFQFDDGTVGSATARFYRASTP